jgi:hypothetical protein
MKVVKKVVEFSASFFSVRVVRAERNGVEWSRMSASPITILSFRSLANFV